MEKKKKQRRRDNPVKKWSEAHINNILDFIHETGNFEVLTKFVLNLDFYYP